MFTKKSEVKPILEQYQKLFAPYIQKLCTITFDKHILTNVRIYELALCNTTGLKNAPNKRTDSDGKQRSPLLFSIHTDSGDLQFCFDDTQVAPIMDGIRITVGSFVIDIRLEHI